MIENPFEQCNWIENNRSNINSIRIVEFILAAGGCQRPKRLWLIISILFRQSLHFYRLHDSFVILYIGQKRRPNAYFNTQRKYLLEMVNLIDMTVSSRYQFYLNLRLPWFAQFFFQKWSRQGFDRVSTFYFSIFVSIENFQLDLEGALKTSLWYGY